MPATHCFGRMQPHPARRMAYAQYASRRIAGVEGWHAAILEAIFCPFWEVSEATRQAAEGGVVGGVDGRISVDVPLSITYLCGFGSDIDRHGNIGSLMRLQRRGMPGHAVSSLREWLPTGQPLLELPGLIPLTERDPAGRGTSPYCASAEQAATGSSG